MLGFLRRKKTRVYPDPTAALAAGDFDGAIAHYRKELARRPRQAANWQRKIAEIHVLAGRHDEAIEAFLAAARHYEGEDLTLQAIAIYKAVLRLDPENERVRAMLAEIARDPSDVGAGVPGGSDPTQMTIRTRLRKYAPLFSEFDYETLSAIIEVTQTHHFESGGIVFEQGDPGDSLFIIASGEVALTVLGPGGEQVELERLSDNDCFGEVSALSRAPRNVSAVATAPTEALELGRDYLEAVAITYPQIWGILERFQQSRLIPAGV